MEIEHLRAVKSTLNGTVARVIQELEEAQLPAQRAEGHAELLRVRVSLYLVSNLMYVMQLPFPVEESLFPFPFPFLLPFFTLFYILQHSLEFPSSYIHNVFTFHSLIQTCIFC